MCRDSLIGLPLCSVSSRATSSARSSSRSPSLRTSRPRSRADIVPHGPSSAARAAATAASRSSPPARRHLRDDLLGRRVDDIHRLRPTPRRATRC